MHERWVHYKHLIVDVRLTTARRGFWLHHFDGFVTFGVVLAGYQLFIAIGRSL